MVVSITNLTSLSLSGSLSSSGWTGRVNGVKIGADLEPDKIVEIEITDKLLQVWDSYSLLLIKGFIPGYSIRRDWVTGRVDFDIVTGQYYLERLPLPGFVFVQGAGESPHQPAVLNHPYVVRHILEAHSNFIQYVTLDIDASGNSFSEYTIEEQMMMGIIQQCAKDDMKVVYCDRNNVFHYVKHPATSNKFHTVSDWVVGIINTYRSDVVPAVKQWWPWATDGQCIWEWWNNWNPPEATAYDTIEDYCVALSGQTAQYSNWEVITFTSDLCTEISPERRTERQCSQVYARGFIHDPTQQVEKLYPYYPDPGGGEIVKIEGIPVSSQGELDAYAAAEYQWRNRNWKVRIKDVRNHRLDLLDIIGVTFVDADEGINWQNKLFVIESATLDFSWEDGTPKLVATYEAEELT